MNLNKKLTGAAIAASLTIAQVARPPVMENNVKSVVQPVNNPELIETEPSMTLGTMTGVYDSEIDMVKESIVKANAVLHSDCFKQKILHAQFTETNGLTNEQIWHVLSTNPIVTGVEIFNGNWRQNYIWKTMGYDVGDGVTYVNRHFLSGSDELASLEIHEAEGHAQGFHHYQAHSTSVPYQENDFYDECNGVN